MEQQAVASQKQVEFIGIRPEVEFSRGREGCSEGEFSLEREGKEQALKR
jgi:hypothetical protein